jgi:hypothetical protein
MTEELKKALEEVCSMKEPFVEKILRKYGFGYEADKIKELVTTYEKDYPEKVDPLNKEVEMNFRNFYRCPYCSTEWEDVWDSMCDDDCPACEERHISPYKSEDIKDGTSGQDRESYSDDQDRKSYT